MTALALDTEVELPTAADTEALGERLADGLGAGDLVVLTGPLGAGKTVLVRGLARGLGVTGPVTSPTFVIAREHRPLPGGRGAAGARRRLPARRPRPSWTTSTSTPTSPRPWSPSSGARGWPSGSPPTTCSSGSTAGPTTSASRRASRARARLTGARGCRS